MNLRNQIQRIALRWPAYGYRRVHAELLRQGWSVNHKRILRLIPSRNAPSLMPNLRNGSHAEVVRVKERSNPVFNLSTRAVREEVNCARNPTT